VLDLMMPEVNGHDVLEALREDEITDDVPILVLTAVTQSRERERCLAEGADRVMTKPFDPRDVATVIDDMLHLPPVPSFRHAS
jgi:CheY-like chemotaxis protein